MIDEKNIEKLLAAFFNGETTTEEESLLNEFFSNDDLPEKWYVDRDLFRALYDTSDIQIPNGLSERLEKSLDEHITATKQTKVNHSNIRQLYFKIGSIAAAVLLCIGLFFTVNKPNEKMMADTFTDPKEAEIVTEQTLAFVSAKLNKGLDPIEKAQKNMDKTNEILKKLNFK